VGDLDGWQLLVIGIGTGVGSAVVPLLAGWRGLAVLRSWLEERIGAGDGDRSGRIASSAWPFVEGLPLAALHLDRSGLIVWANDQFGRQFGRRTIELQGAAIDDLFPEAQASAIRTAARRCCSERLPVRQSLALPLRPGREVNELFDAWTFAIVRADAQVDGTAMLLVPTTDPESTRRI
jgi:PAS domain-containing protein